MKRILLLTTLICSALCCSSCEKDLTSLDGTTWTDGYTTTEGVWREYRLVFTSTHATYTDSYKSGTNFTGTYTYDPPTVTISAAVSGEAGMAVVDMTGTIKKKTMHIGIHQTDDLVAMMDLKKQ